MLLSNTIILLGGSPDEPHHRPHGECRPIPALVSAPSVWHCCNNVMTLLLHCYYTVVTLCQIENVDKYRPSSFHLFDFSFRRGASPSDRVVTLDMRTRNDAHDDNSYVPTAYHARKSAPRNRFSFNFFSCPLRDLCVTWACLSLTP
jgi:hypothetical protein